MGVRSDDFRARFMRVSPPKYINEDFLNYLFISLFFACACIITRTSLCACIIMRTFLMGLYNNAYFPYVLL